MIYQRAPTDTFQRCCSQLEGEEDSVSMKNLPNHDDCATLG